VRGFTLVELLIALGLAGLLLGVVLSASAGASRRHGELEAAALLQERGRHVLGLLEPELQLAGYGGLAPLTALPWPSGFPAAVVACGTVGSVAVPLRVDEGGYALSCPAQGGGARLGSHVLTVQRAGARLAAPEPGRVLVISSRRTAGTRGVLVDGRLPAGVVVREGLDELHDLTVVTFYVARQADGAPAVPALRLKELTSIAGRPALRDVELAAGVEDLCVQRTGASVTVTVRLRSDRPLLPRQSRVFACGDRQETATDGFLRATVARTFALRNGEGDPP
jgi:prepilin-type N-terminal cleavage/methylation domain-containing protein